MQKYITYLWVTFTEQRYALQSFYFKTCMHATFCCFSELGCHQNKLKSEAGYIVISGGKVGRLWRENIFCFMVSNNPPREAVLKHKPVFQKDSPLQ